MAPGSIMPQGEVEKEVRFCEAVIQLGNYVQHVVG
jgi:hypothetical protein